DYNRSHEPRCSTSPGWVVVDALVGGSDLAVAGVILAKGVNNNEAAAGILVSSLIEGLVFGASAATGVHWISDCNQARREYDGEGDSDGRTGYVGGEDSPEAAALRRERAEALKRRHPADESQRPIVEGEKPIYCATTESADIGVCNIDPDRCEAAKRDGEAH